MNTSKELSNLKEIVLEPPKGFFSINFKEIWYFRELLYFFVWRDIKVRYKQTLLGAAWAILQPLMTMVIFSVIFGRFAKLPSDGIPYPIFSYTALLPWQLFSKALSSGSSSVVSNQNFIRKVYFPRLFLPASTILSGVVDFLIALCILFLMMVYYRIQFSIRLLLLPVLIVFALTASLSVSIWLAAINVKYRDVRYVLPFLIQAWLYATPIAYSTSIVPEQWRVIYGLNPMVGIVEGFRWALLGQQISISSAVGASILIVLILFVVGLMNFQRMEKTFSDII